MRAAVRPREPRATRRVHGRWQPRRPRLTAWKVRLAEDRSFLPAKYPARETGSACANTRRETEGVRARRCREPVSSSLAPPLPLPFPLTPLLRTSAKQRAPYELLPERARRWRCDLWGPTSGHLHRRRWRQWSTTKLASSSPAPRRRSLPLALKPSEGPGEAGRWTSTLDRRPGGGELGSFSTTGSVVVKREDEVGIQRRPGRASAEMSSRSRVTSHLFQPQSLCQERSCAQCSIVKTGWDPMKLASHQRWRVNERTQRIEWRSPTAPAPAAAEPCASCPEPF